MGNRTWRTRAVGGVLVLVIGATLLSGCALTGVVQMEMGETTSCAVRQDGTVVCWGSNHYGALGRGFVTPGAPGGIPFPTPAPVLGVGGATAVAVGYNGASTLLADTTVTCWGNGSGNASPKAGLSGVVSISLGYYHGCAVLEDTSVVCWGPNTEGERGLGTTDPVGPLPTPVPGLTGVVAIDAGLQYTSAVRDDGSIACWGRNDSDQLGVANSPIYVERQTSPTTIPGLVGVEGVSAGAQHTCANLADGTVQCWGSGVAGQLGRGGFNIHGPTPAPVVGLTGATSVSVAGDFGAGSTCATIDDGTVRCWGENSWWQLGDLTTGNRDLPVAVANLTNVTAVSVSTNATCATGGGGVSCWGNDRYGRLGLGPVPAPTGVPRPVLRVEGAARVSAGDESSCAIVGDGSVRCWGTNENGEAGTGVNESTVWPSTVALVDGAQSISSATGSCALVADGSAWCWGSVLGGGRETAEPTGPGYPPSTLTLTDVSVGGSHRCATRSNGTIRCWGFNTAGQLGDGQPPSGSLYPRSTTVVGVADAAEVYAGPSNSCTRRAGGTVSCWGANTFGQLGNGTTAAATSPVNVTGLSGVAALSGAGNHVCALMADTTLRCWGSNASGELGDGTTVNRTSPVAVLGLSGVVKVSATAGHTCAVLGDGTVRCWGKNDQGQLGNGGAGGPSTAPQVVTGMSGVTDIAASTDHTCASRTDGSVWCWGANDSGKAGSGVRGTFPASVVAAA